LVAKHGRLWMATGGYVLYKSLLGAQASLYGQHSCGMI